jgi:hypothetical protein
MTDRAKVVETVQFGPESTEGTAVPATKNIRSVSVDTKIGGAAEMFRPDGRKYNTLAVTNQEWSTLAINGKGTYTEIIYLLAMAFGDPSAASSGVAAKTRTYEALDTTLLTPKAMTIEKGSSVRAQKIAGAILTDFDMTFSRKAGINVTGNGIGRLFTDGITITPSLPDVPLIPIAGKHLDCYIDSTSAGLGTTKLLRAFSMEHTHNGIYGPVWAIDSAQTSYTAHVDLAPTTGVKLMVEADSAGMAYLSQYRSDDLLFVRMKATGPNITGETSIPYSFTYDTCVAIKTVEPDTDEDGVTTVTYDCEFVKDSTWGKAQSIVVVNNIATL